LFLFLGAQFFSLVPGSLNPIQKGSPKLEGGPLLFLHKGNGTLGPQLDLPRYYWRIYNSGVITPG